MLKNYIKITLRNLLKNKSYTLINIVGLAFGLACCILITLYVIHEVSYDKFHENFDEIFRVTETRQEDGEPQKYASTYSALAPALNEEFASIEHITHVYPTSGLIIGPGNLKYQEEGMIYADSSFFEMFSFELLKGNPERALDRPLTMVITEKIAAKFFGNVNPVGRTLRFEGSRNAFDYEITGVVKSPPTNSHIQFDYVISYESLRNMKPWEYNVKYYPPMYTYVKLNSAEAEADIEEQFPGFVKKYYGDWDDAETSAFSLQPISDIHLYSNLQNELSTNFDITYVYLFLAIAVFILVIACINFMNLATARSMNRAREVGMRKTLGANRRQLIGQFLGEAIIMTALSLGLAILGVETFLPWFNEVAGKELTLGLFANRQVIAALIGGIIAVGLLAGSYPAFYLSSFNPVQALKGDKGGESTSTANFRKGLVVFQFCISTVLIFATIVISKQLDYVKNERLGFDKEQVVIIPIRETEDQFNVETLKQEILGVPGVESASAVSGVPGIRGGIHGFKVVPEQDKADSLMMQTITVDHDYVETLGLELVKGRDFSKAFGTDTEEAFIINETAAKRMGWSDSPLNKELTLHYYVEDLIRKKGKVIGVVKDFQYHSLHQSIDPVLIHVFPKTFYHDYLSVRLSTDNIQEVIGSLKEKWSIFNPERPFEYSFLDDTFDAMYRSEIRLGKIFNAFALVAIFVACLGLFGLASYSTEQRKKEIGIRKVLGAKIKDIIGLLGKETTLLIITSQIIALPLAYVMMSSWLSNYADRIVISAWLFVASSITILFIAWATISYQSVKAAVMNPVNSLRSE